MKSNNPVIAWITVGLFMVLPKTTAQDLGATFCWHYNEIYGGHSYPYNQSIAKQKLPDGIHWSATTEWWENMVEEIDYSGIDFVALLSRGNQPNAPDRGNGNPIHIPKLINAMDARGCDFKLSIFDDCPNSWTGSMNWDLSAGAVYSTDSPKFDCSNPELYKYIWDYNLKQAIANIPDEKRYKIDGRMVIFFWSAKPTWMTNLQGNLSKILQYIKDQCQATYGFIPFLIIDRDWLDNDNTLNTETVDAVHNWFSAAGMISYTLQSWNGMKTGACVPGFGTPNNPSTFLDPSMGTTDKGLRLKTGLENTVNAGARTTLVEGFTDAAEAAALWRSTDHGTHTFYEYANQRLNILRRYTRNPFPGYLKVEAEACDFYSDLTSGNSGGAFLYSGDLDVLKCADTYGGWHVTSTQAGEWMEWNELPLLANTKFRLRYQSTATSSVKITVDGTDLATMNLPSTSGVWSTIDAGNYTAAGNSLHTVRLTIVSGSPNINYFERVVDGTFAVTGVTVTPAVATVAPGGTCQLTAEIVPVEASNRTVSWTTSNSSVAIVNSNGLVTAVGEGTATITATTQDGGKTDESVITVTSSLGETQTLQAEDAVHGGAIVNTNQAGYHGTGFIDFINPSGDYIEWSVTVEKAGTYSLAFRYALPNGGRPLELMVNGSVKVASLDFPGTGLWTNWETITINQELNAGVNKIQLSTNGSNGGNIDELTVGYIQTSTDIPDNGYDEEPKSFTIYPNPYRQGRLSLKLKGFENASLIHVKIVTLTGQVVYEHRITGSTGLDLNLSGKLDESVYLICIESDRIRIVEKLIVN